MGTAAGGTFDRSVVPGCDIFGYQGSGPSQLVNLAPAPPSPPPRPTISVVGGTVALSVSGSLGAFAAGSTVISEQTSLKDGFLTLGANGNTRVHQPARRVRHRR